MSKRVDFSIVNHVVELDKAILRCLISFKSSCVICIYAAMPSSVILSFPLVNIYCPVLIVTLELLCSTIPSNIILDTSMVSGK